MRELIKSDIFSMICSIMETNRLKQFCVIIETGSLVKASELLHITHSALSKSMKLLQDEVGLSLLRPAGRGIVPTEEGVKIYRRAKDFLEMENTLFKLDQPAVSSSVKIGAVEIFLLSICEGLHKNSLSNKFISLLDIDPGKMEQMISNHQLDFGITYAPFPIENIEIKEIGTYRLGCYYLNEAFKSQSISDIPFVVPATSLSTNPLSIKERDGWLESLNPRNNKFSVNLLSTAIELTLQGYCAVYMPEFVAKKINQTRDIKSRLMEYPLGKHQQVEQRAFLLRHEDRKEDDVSRQICGMIKDIIQKESDATVEPRGDAGRKAPAGF